jgi:hypothetical protein
MPTLEEQRAAFRQAEALLRSAAAASALALPASRGTAAEAALDRQLEHALDRLAVLHGHGTYENLETADIVRGAADLERRLAAELGGSEAADSEERARLLIDAARRGVRLHVREPSGPVRLYRGAYVEPLRPELERWLWQLEEPHLRWRDGVVLVLDEDEIAALRAAGDEVDVLFLDSDELLDLDARDDRAALESEMERRLAAARAAPDAVGDSRDRYLLRMLLRQSNVLRNLRDRLADGHPSAHAALLPVLAAHRALLAPRLAAAPPARAARRDPLGAAIDSERDVLAHIRRWAAEPDDPAGLRNRFLVVSDAGTRLAELEQHHA